MLAKFICSDEDEENSITVSQKSIKFMTEFLLKIEKNEPDILFT